MEPIIGLEVSLSECRLLWPFYSVIVIVGLHQPGIMKILRSLAELEAHTRRLLTDPMNLCVQVRCQDLSIHHGHVLLLWVQRLRARELSRHLCCSISRAGFHQF